jgi:hypothetical protein
MDLELAQLQLADMQAQVAAMATRKALQDKQYSKQRVDALAKIAQLQADITEAQTQGE